ncbi:MAG: hypothetical protein HFF06_08970 [Oscillospiraceae bacterium]|jgi:translation elongation factor EF-Tu-like GTPase|nr:hypothetical protein [Oscillospiraceae bacterium]
MFGWLKGKKEEKNPALENFEKENTPAEPFRMTVEDVFIVGTGRGRRAVVTGRIETGRVARGDELTRQGRRGIRRLTVAGIESSRRPLEEARAGDRVGLLFKGLGGKDEIAAGDLLTRKEAGG